MKLSLIMILFFSSLTAYAGRPDVGDHREPLDPAVEAAHAAAAQRHIELQIAKVHVDQVVLVRKDQEQYGSIVQYLSYPKDVTPAVVHARVLSKNGREVTVVEIVNEQEGEKLTVDIAKIFVPMAQVNWYDRVNYNIGDSVDVGVSISKHLFSHTIMLASGTILELYGNQVYGIRGSGEYVAKIKFDDKNEYPKEETYISLSSVERKLNLTIRERIRKWRTPENCLEMLSGRKLHVRTGPVL